MVAKTILVVDDDADLTKLIAIALERSGYHAITGHSGREAIDRVDELGDRIDLVVLDILMPQIDGYEVARHIRGNPATRNIPMLLCTGQGQEAVAEGLDLSGIDCIVKPFTMEQLLFRIDAVLRQDSQTT